jgi:hypothetical protein
LTFDTVSLAGQNDFDPGGGEGGGGVGGGKGGVGVGGGGGGGGGVGGGGGGGVGGGGGGGGVGVGGRGGGDSRFCIFKYFYAVRYSENFAVDKKYIPIKITKYTPF